jgi:DNA-binding transcriptional regulator YhcF (GntR family)
VLRAFDKAEAYLRKQAEAAESLQRPRLDTHEQMARQAGVSNGTMLKAVRLLCDEGVLVSKRKAGVRLAKTVASPQRPLPDSGWRGIVQRMRTDIIAGSMAPDVWLSAKELTRRYGGCFRTAKRALQALEEDHLLVRQQRGYRLAVPRAGRREQNIVLTGVGSANGNLDSFTPRTLELLRTPERACFMRSMRLSVVAYDYRAARFVSRRAQGIGWDQELRSSRGCIALTTSMPPAALGELALACSRRRVPLALVDEGSVSAAVRVPQQARSRVFHMVVDARAGLITGHYLRRLGHRRIAYLCPYHLESWSADRLLGLREAYGSVHTKDDPVREFTIGSIEELFRTFLQKDVAEKAFFTLDPVSRYLDPADGLSIECVEQMRSAMFHVARSEILRRRMRPLFEQALGDTGTTAWVTGNDDVAGAALDFLQETRTAVPDAISVVGFDNTTTASARGLTSFSFSEARVIDTAMRYLLDEGQRSEPRRMAPASVAIDGFIVESDTVALRR